MSSTVWRALGWLPVGFVLSDVVASLTVVSGSSMSPTLNPGAGSTIVLCEKISVRLFKFNPGDVVVLRSPNEPRRLLIKRLIAVEADWLAMPGSGRVERIAKGACWVEGDNRANSEDSTSFGAVPLALLQGRAVCAVWPPSQWGWIESRLPPGRLVALGGAGTAAYRGSWERDRWT